MSVRPSMALCYDNGSPRATEECLAEELPLQVKVNGESFTTTMRTPGMDRELARGLLHTEGIIPPEAQISNWREQKAEPSGTIVCIDIHVPHQFILKEVKGRRALVSATSCGLCGKRELDEAALKDDATPLRTTEHLDVAAIPSLFAVMREAQSTFDASGGVHASAVFDGTGRMLAIAEDVGRHNAVDKVVGALLLNRRLDEGQVLLASGRLSFEIVSKAWMAGLPFVLAVSAASSLAVELGEKLGLTVAGFCRDGRATVYTHTERITRAGAPFGPMMHKG